VTGQKESTTIAMSQEQLLEEAKRQARDEVMKELEKDDLRVDKSK